MSDFSDFLQKTGEFGQVSEVRQHVAVIDGLPHVKPSEVVLFESGHSGEVFSVERNTCEVLTYSREPIRVGEKVSRTGDVLKIPVGKELLGRIINPFGSPLIGVLGYKKPAEQRAIDTKGPGIFDRALIKKQFLTGVSMVDLVIPLGLGQRELILGDRKTGKSTFLLGIVKHQVKLGNIVIYCAIGRKKNDVKRIDDYIRKEKLMDSTVVVASAYDDPASLVFLAPYAAMTIAEYFRDQGRDVCLILDDLTTHAKYYREISLLSGRFPGRDSYPGDIFYIHSKLLERAGNFIHPQKGEVSITCLPIAETLGEDLNYIVTNLMGMTDGHIFFDTNLYYKGRRPAINSLISVTRVGKQAQNKLAKEAGYEVSVFLNSYEKYLALSHFGSELSPTVKEALDKGDRLANFFDQEFSQAINLETQLVLLALIWTDYFKEKDIELIELYRTKMIQAGENFDRLALELVSAKNFNEFLENVKSRKEEIFSVCKIGYK